MKHIKNIIIFTFMFLIQIIATVLGWFLIPIFMFRMEKFIPEHKESRFEWQKRFKDKWFDAIYGNKEDGIADIYYTKKFPQPYTPTFLRTYNWLAFRNPIHNLALKMGVNEKIISYTWEGNRYTEDRIGKEGFVYSKAKGASGRIYPMYRWCKLLYKNYGIEATAGYKNFNIKDVPKHYKYSFTVSFNPFKRFEG